MDWSKIKAQLRCARPGWKLLAIVAAWLFTPLLVLFFLQPMAQGFVGFARALAIGIFLASLLDYGFGRPWLPLHLWRTAAPIFLVASVMGVAFFVSYMATRLAVIPLDGGGVAFTLTQIVVAIALEACCLVPMLRLGRYIGPGRIPIGRFTSIAA